MKPVLEDFPYNETWLRYPWWRWLSVYDTGSFSSTTDVGSVSMELAAARPPRVRFSEAI